MTDKRIKMECPFCHCPPERIELKIFSPKMCYGEIFCPDCGCHFTGVGKQNLINKWNRR